MNTSLAYDLDKARKYLTELQDELPQYHALLTDNEQDAQRLKTERASLDTQAQAKGRVEVARELLEQHQSDIRTARAEVERLELARAREEALAEMVRQAELTVRCKAAFDTQLAKASKALEGHVRACLEAHDGLTSARQAFDDVGADGDLMREFQGRGLRLAEGPDPHKPYRFPEPYGGFVWAQVYQELVSRAEAARRERLEQQAEERRKRRELEHPPEPELAKLYIDQRDAPAAAHRLGELIQAVGHIDKGMVGGKHETVFSILPTDLEQARERLKGALTFGDATVRRPESVELEGTPA